MRQPSSKSAQGGVALIEAMVAIFIFSIGVLAVIGMQAVSIRTAADAKYRADAAFLADQVIGLMWIDQTNITSYAVAGTCNLAGSGSLPGSSNAQSWLRTVDSTLPGAASNRQRVEVTQIVTPLGFPLLYQVTVTVCWQSKLASPTAPDVEVFHNHVITTRISNNNV